jgi:hypothetical protein
MEYNFIQAYDRRMRKFNSLVIAALLACLVLLVILFWPVLN